MIIRQELQERSSLHLPPYARVARFTLAADEATRFKSALVKAKEESLIPPNTEILGPIPSGDKASLIISTPVADGEALIKTLHEFMRRRSAAKKLLPTMRIDPYSLSH
jgi:primosomal protein N'